MKRFLLAAIIIAFLLISSSSPSVLADGMIIPPIDYRVFESEQKAVIFHDGKKETLILQISFKGDAKDFAWIVPVPSKPEVDKGQDSLFTALENLTRQQIVLYDKALQGVGGEEGAAESQVSVIETKKVDIYDIQVLTATDSKALIKWFEYNNYPYPDHASYILNSYINNKWFFVAAKVSTEALGSMVADQLKEGHATPLKITFDTEKIVYPLRISSVLALENDNPPKDRIQTGTTGVNKAKPEDITLSNPDSDFLQPEPSSRKFILPPKTKYAGVTLYIFANHKKEIPNFDTQYANFVKPKDIEKLAQNDIGDPWIKTTKKMYLTKLYRYLATSQMTNDLFPQNASDNKRVPPGAYLFSDFEWEKIFLIVLPLILELAVIAIIVIKRIRTL